MSTSRVSECVGGTQLDIVSTVCAEAPGVPAMSASAAASGARMRKAASWIVSGRPSRPAKSVSSPSADHAVFACMATRRRRGGAADSSLTLNAMTSRPLSLGFVGLGVMGRPMASHLAAAGHAMTLYDIAPGLAHERRRGARRRARRRATPAELAARSDIVVTMVPNGAVVQALVYGDDGRCCAACSPARCCSTPRRRSRGSPRRPGASSPRPASRWSTRRSRAPSGAPRRPSSSSCAAAPRADLERVRPLLERMGKAVFHLGPLGAGHAMKCLNNLVTALNFLAVERRPGDRQALRPRSGGDGRRARPLDRHVVGLADAHPPARHQPQLRRSVQARADAEGHRHRDAAGAQRATCRRRSRRSARSSGARGRAPRPTRARELAREAERQRAGALGSSACTGSEISAGAASSQARDERPRHRRGRLSRQRPGRTRCASATSVVATDRGDGDIADPAHVARLFARRSIASFTSPRSSAAPPRPTSTPAGASTSTRPLAPARRAAGPGAARRPGRALRLRELDRACSARRCRRASTTPPRRRRRSATAPTSASASC